MTRSSRDWVLFSILVFLYGSAFMFIELSVTTITPLTVVTARIALGLVLLGIFLSQSQTTRLLISQIFSSPSK